MSAPFWVDIIEEIVTSVRTDDDKPVAMASDAPYYEYGHPKDLIRKLSQKDKHETLKYKKWPLIALLQDFKETIGENQFVQSAADLNIVIITNTLQDYYADDRYDNTFRTVLYPLYDLLIKHINQSGWFLNVDIGLVPHDKYDRLFWGRAGLYGNEGNIFGDAVDAIEIQNLHLELRLIQKTC